ncbi:MAG: hypothetical protein K5905_24820 [Roseibium sp.]|uniref:hypothetical protein n=1 Tax=Roseibium sp. TaxID=1936156 RepID=UPI0026254D5B|nr:hypothetical protein [Roseibium sp.]MCV0428692.1 hypothetical protein [Roseibium sp.]
MADISHCNIATLRSCEHEARNADAAVDRTISVSTVITGISDCLSDTKTLADDVFVVSDEVKDVANQLEIKVNSFLEKVGANENQ